MSSHGWVERQTEDGLVYYYNLHTDVTQEEKPDVLRTAADREYAGEWVWLSDEQEGYVPSKILEGDPREPKLVETESGEKIRIKPKVHVTIPLQRGALKKQWEDLVQLPFIDEAMIIHNLRARFQTESIYTSIGTILVVVNPYKWLPVYGMDVMEKYRNKGMSTMPPHIFDIADTAYRYMSDRLAAGQPPNQSILISGESGAGKTEATKQALAYLAHVAGSVGGVEKKLLVANPLLEAFGNAATLRNNNSSRFGKWMQVFFDTRRRIAGSRIDNYLLEKSRVTLQTKGERCFHIFYQLTKGANPDMRRRLHLQQPTEYRITKGTVNLGLGFDDTKDWEEVLEAFEVLGFGDEQEDVFQLVAALLHFGNINFVDGEAENSSEIGNNDELVVTAELMGVPPGDLRNAIIKKTLIFKDKRDHVEIPLTPAKASDNRDALLKQIYNSLFNWLVFRVNESIAPPPGIGDLSLIGILDIFGFEIFVLNSFEQLCINYANEKLQQHFNQHTFKLEQQLYESEQITYTPVTFIDNQIVLDLCEKKPDGILTVLDEELLTSGTEERFLQKLNTKQKGKNERFLPTHKNPRTFGIRHYAGEVNYDVTGFLDKNKDTLEWDLLNLVKSSTNKFLCNLLDREATDQKARKQSIGSQFQSQLAQLMRELQATTPHYVRCIKPNSQKKPFNFEGRDVLLQLRYAGVFEAVRIRQTGYPFRFPHKEFMRRYGTINHNKQGSNDRETCLGILRHMKADLNEIQLGKTRVLYRAKSHRMLEVQRSIFLEKMASKIQRVYRGFRARLLYRKMKEVQQLLVAAMARRDLDGLLAAIEKAHTMWFQLRITKDAEAMIKVLEEERACLRRLEALRGQDVERYYDEIMDAIDQAKALGIARSAATSVIAELMDQIREIHERKQAIRNLKKGLELFDKTMLEDGIKVATRLGLEVGPELEAARKALDRIREEDRLVGELTRVLYDSASDDLAALQSALSRGRAFDLRTPEGRALVGKLEATIDLRAAVRDKDWAGLEEAMKRATDLGLDLPDVAKARKGLELRGHMHKAADKLEKEIASHNADALEQALRAALDLEMKTSPWSTWTDLVEEAEAALQRHRDLIKKLEDSQAPGTEEHIYPLQAALAAAHEYGFKVEKDLVLVRRGEIVLKLRKALDAKDWEGLKRAVEEATQLSFDHPEVASAREGLETRKRMAVVAGKVREAMENHDADEMGRSLDEALRLDMAGSKWSTWQSLIAAGQECLRRHREIVKRLEDCIGPGTDALIDPLDAALAAARDYGFKMDKDISLQTRSEITLRLRRALGVRDWEALQKAVDEAVRAGFASMEVETARSGLELRKKMTAVAARVKDAYDGKDAETLEKALRSADELDMANSRWSTWQELVEQSNDRLRLHKKIVASLTSCLGSGTHSLIEPLEAALKDAAAYGFKMDKDVSLHRRGEITLQLRRALLGRDWEALKRAVDEAAAVAYTSGEVEAARTGLGLRKQMAAVAGRIRESMEDHNADNLSLALEDAGALEMTTSFWSTWKDTVVSGEACLARHRKLLAQLKACMAPGTAKHIDQLQVALAEAVDFGFSVASDVAVQRQAEMTLQMRRALLARDWDALRATLNRLHQLGVSNDEVRAGKGVLELREKMEAIASELHRALEMHDATQLGRHLAEARKLDMGDSPYSSWAGLVKDCKDSLRQHRRLMLALTASLTNGTTVQLDMLQKALDDIREYGFYTDADTEQIERAGVVLKLRRAIKERDWPGIKNALDSAVVLRYESNELADVRKGVELRAKMTPVAEQARIATERRDAEKLETLLEDAKRLEMLSSKWSTHHDVIEEAQSTLAKHKLVTEGLRNALREGAVPLDDQKRLLDEAKDFAFRTEGDLSLVQQASLLFSVRTALAVEDWTNVERHLRATSDFGMGTDELRKAREALDVFKQRESISAWLKTAVEDVYLYNYERDTLGQALTQSRALGMDKLPAFERQFKEAQALHEKMIAVQTMLSSGTAQKEEEPLLRGLELAKEIGYESTEVAAARVLYNEMKAINDAFKDAYAARDVKEMKRCLKRAALIEYNNGRIPELKRVLPICVYEEGELRVERFAGMRAAGPAGGLTYTRDSIGAPLTQVDAGSAKAAVKAFDSLLSFTGEKKGFFSGSKAGSTKVMEEIIAAATTPELADELYVQLIKQLTNNSDPVSEQWGWRLMERYVQSLAPSRAFYPHLEWYLSNVPREGEGRLDPKKYTAYLKKTMSGR